MNCDDVRSALYVYLDGEFAPPEARRFEGHLESCSACAALIQHEREFLANFRNRAGRVRVPAGLKTRITATLQAPSAGPPHRSLGGSAWTRVVAMAAVIGLIAVSAWAFTRGDAPDDAAVSGAVAAHRRNLPMEVRGSHEQVRTFLQENVPFAVKLPYLDADGMELTGARLIQVDRRPAVLFNYELDGRRISVIQMHAAPAEERLRGQPPRVEDRQGYRVVTYRNSGLMNSVVGPVRAGDRLIPASFKSH